MATSTSKYCLDTSALIQPWNSYYSIALCPQYWDLLHGLAQQRIVFCTQLVAREIEKEDDELAKWIKQRPFLFWDVTPNVQHNLRKILASHRELVDVKKDRSMADPWVIAHAMTENATVVTKEGFAPRKIKIPDVCRDYGLRCIDDIEFVREIGITFTAQR